MQAAVIYTHGLNGSDGILKTIIPEEVQETGQTIILKPGLSSLVSMFHFVNQQ